MQMYEKPHEANGTIINNTISLIILVLLLSLTSTCTWLYMSDEAATPHTEMYLV